MRVEIAGQRVTQPLGREVEALPRLGKEFVRPRQGPRETVERDGACR